MVLIRGYSRVEADGRIAIPTNMQRFAGLLPEYPVNFSVRKVFSSRRPHICFSRPSCPPFLSTLEVIMMEGATSIDEEGKIALYNAILEEAKLEPGHLVEMKVLGPRGAHWIVLQNRVRLLMPTKATKEKKWHRMEIQY